MKTIWRNWTVKPVEIDDLDQFYINMLMAGARKADKYWHECLETGEPYCYGRGNVYLNLYYAEQNWFKMSQTWIPNDVWKLPNIIFQKLLKLKGII